MKVAVTGGCGFVGSHLVERLVHDGNTVVVLDNLSSGVIKNIENVTNRGELILTECDIVSPEIDSVIKNSEVVVHLAATTGVVKCSDDPLGAIQNNVTGTMNVLRASVSAGVRLVVFASSGAVYGSQSSFPLTEDMHLAPSSVYGATKAAGEEFCHAYSKSYGLQTIILRFTNLYGPRRNPAYPSAMMNFAKAVLVNAHAEIYGDGNQTRDFTNVADAVQAIVLAIEKGEGEGEVFNIGTGVRTSINELIEIFSELAGTQLSVRHLPPRVGDIKDSYVDISKARSVLGYEPSVKLRDGISELLDWMRKSSTSDYHNW